MRLRTARFKQRIDTEDEISRNIAWIVRYRTAARQYAWAPFSQAQLPCLRHPKNITLSICSRGESLGGFVTLSAAREEARAAGLTSWDIFQGNVRIERHDPGVDESVAHVDVAQAGQSNC